MMAAWAETTFADRDAPICAKCGRVGKDVIWFPKLVNGKWTKEAECQDIAECLARQGQKT